MNIGLDADLAGRLLRARADVVVAGGSHAILRAFAATLTDTFDSA